jgi:hypothetical protein
MLNNNELNEKRKPDDVLVTVVDVVAVVVLCSAFWVEMGVGCWVLGVGCWVWPTKKTSPADVQTGINQGFRILCTFTNKYFKSKFTTNLLLHRANCFIRHDPKHSGEDVRAYELELLVSFAEDRCKVSPIRFSHRHYQHR